MLFQRVDLKDNKSYIKYEVDLDYYSLLIYNKIYNCFRVSKYLFKFNLRQFFCKEIKMNCFYSFMRLSLS